MTSEEVTSVRSPEDRKEGRVKEAREERVGMSRS